MAVLLTTRMSCFISTWLRSRIYISKYNSSGN